MGACAGSSSEETRWAAVGMGRVSPEAKKVGGASGVSSNRFIAGGSRDQRSPEETRASPLYGGGGVRQRKGKQPMGYKQRGGYLSLIHI